MSAPRAREYCLPSSGRTGGRVGGIIQIRPAYYIYPASPITQRGVWPDANLVLPRASLLSISPSSCTLPCFPSSKDIGSAKGISTACAPSQNLFRSRVIRGTNRLESAERSTALSTIRLFDAARSGSQIRQRTSLVDLAAAIREIRRVFDAENVIIDHY